MKKGTNRMADVAKILGLKLGEIFYIKELSEKGYSRAHKLTKCGCSFAD